MRAALFEIIGYRSQTFVLEHAADDLRAVIELFAARDVERRTARAEPYIVSAEHDAFYARIDHRARAHRARFQRDVQLAVAQIPPPELLRRGADRHDLGMRRRVVVGFPAV